MVISVTILIEFKSTHELAIDEARLAHSGFVASVCGHVRMQGIYSNKHKCTKYKSRRSLC